MEVCMVGKVRINIYILLYEVFLTFAVLAMQQKYRTENSKFSTFLLFEDETTIT